MTRVLFAHNGPLYRGSDGHYYGTHYTESVKQRYLQLGDHVTFLMREKPLKAATARFSAISPDNFRFVAVPDLMSPSRRFMHHRHADRVIAQAVRDCDLLVARLPSLTARLAIGWARRLGKPYMAECVACNWDALWNHHWKARVSAPWYFWMQRKAVGSSNWVLYVTEQFLQRRYPTTGTQAGISDVLLEPVPGRCLEQRLHQIATRAHAAVPSKLVTVANIAVPYKGQADVIRSLPALIARGVDVQYHLIGAGDGRRLEEMAENLGVRERVVLHGAIPHQRVFQLLDDMDIYIQPSRQEGLPRAVIEAMSRGLPVLGAQTGGIPELLDERRVFRPGAVEEISAAVAAILPAEEQGADARRNFARAGDFSSDELDRRRADFYRRFLQHHGLSAPACLST